MANDVRVLEDGLEREQDRRGQAPWLWLVVGFVVGLGVSVVFLAPLATPGPATSLVDAGPNTPAVPRLPTETVGISRVIPDFPDALVAIAEVQPSSLEYLLWPYSGAFVIRPLPIGPSGSVAVNPSGRWTASLLPLPDPEGSLLSMGLVSQIAPVVTGVDSFMWHDSLDGVLGYIQVDEAGWSLSVTSMVRVPEKIAVQSSGTETPELAAFGEWGFALFYPGQGRFDLLTREGQFRTTVDAVPLASHPSGWLLAVGDQPMMVSAGGGVRRISHLFLAGDRPLAGAISPDATKVAVLASDGIAIGSIDGSESPVMVDMAPRAPQVAWSSDSRFVMAPGSRGVSVYDTEEQQLYHVLEDRFIRWAGVIPLTPGS